jgi:DNA-binding GntR family transcriptional regulator
VKTNGVMPRLGSSTVRTAHRDVTDRLRQAIVSGLLPAGTHLVQAELAASLQVSVTPVREALRELESQGLVDFDPFRGATVHDVSLKELEEVYELLRLLMPIAIRERMETISEEEIDEADRIADRMTKHISDAEWIEANHALHSVLDGTSGPAHLRAILRRLTDVRSLYVGVSVLHDASRRGARLEHKELIRAYRARNADRAIEVGLNHLNDAATVAAGALGGTVA